MNFGPNQGCDPQYITSEALRRFYLLYERRLVMGPISLRGLTMLTT